MSMISERQFTELIERGEGKTLDYKRDRYDTTITKKKYDLVKDVLAMANTPRDDSAYIVLGVEKEDGQTKLLGVNKHDDEADMQSQFTDRVHPIPEFTYEIVSYEGKSFGVIVIPPVRRGPCVPVRDYEQFLRRHQVYWRVGSKNDTASPDDIKRIQAWADKTTEPPVVAEPDFEDWGVFVDCMQNFSSSRTFVLVTDVPSTMLDQDSEMLGFVDWPFVIDLDPYSDQRGLFKSIRPRLESKRSVHRVARGDRPTLNVGRGTYWFFARGIAGSDESIESKTWLEWRQVYGNEVRQQIANFAKASLPTPVTVVALLYSEGLTDYLNSIFDDFIASYGSAVDFVIATGNASEAQTKDVVRRFDSALVQIPLSHICSGLKALYASELDPASESAVLPSSSGAPIPIDASDLNWIEEEIELVHLNVGIQMDNERHTGVDFLKGNQVTWHELGLRYDVERDISGRLLQQVQRALRERRSVRFNLFHASGAGGTTVARRLIWDVHKSHPCGILRSSEPRETVERLQYIFSKTGQSILLLADGSEVSSGEMDELAEYAKAHHVPVVIMQVLRRIQSNGARSTRRARGRLASHVLNRELSIAECNRFAHILSREAPTRTAALNNITKELPPNLHTPFYFCLQAFGKDFIRLDSYVESRLAELTETQRELLTYLSIAHKYGQKSIPAQSFAHMLGVPQNRTVNLRNALSDEGLDLVIETATGEWRTAHSLIADELLEQLLWPSSNNRENWRQNLSRWAVKFVRFSRGHNPVPSDTMLELARRTFVYRGNVELLGTEGAATEQFAALLEDIPVKEGRLEVLRELTEEFSEEAHFWAHLGRFYAMEMRSFPDAVDCVDRALLLQPDDAVLHHMKGMGLRSHTEFLIEQREDLSKVIKIAMQACESFAMSRDRNPDSEHGYISEVQLVSKVLDYAGRLHPQGLHGYLKNPSAEPFVQRGLERSEDLLEQARRIREGGEPSTYERDCRGKLDSLYGRHDEALQVWDSLLNNRNVYSPPIRRQIVRTYLARRDRSWDALSEHELTRTAGLLEDNLNEEPNNDRNMRMWIQAIRRVSEPPSIESVIEKVAYWQVDAGSIDATYYLYVLNAILALEGSVLAGQQAERHLQECRQRARLRRNRQNSFEWIGPGIGLTRLVHHSRLGDWDHSTDFWGIVKPLARVQGRITRIQGPGAGMIRVAGGLSTFFVPVKGGFALGRSENQAVDFYLGFSYDGLRAFEVKPV